MPGEDMNKMYRKYTISMHYEHHLVQGDFIPVLLVVQTNDVRPPKQIQPFADDERKISVMDFLLGDVSPQGLKLKRPERYVNLRNSFKFQ